MKSANHILTTALVALVLSTLAGASWARDHYVIPPKTMEIEKSDGSRTAPWTTLWGALNNEGGATSGDRIILLPGHYGDIFLQVPVFDPPVRIEPLEPGSVHMTSLRVTKGGGLTFSGLSFWPRVAKKRPKYMIETFPKVSHVRFEGLTMRGAPPSAPHWIDWSKDDWKFNWAPNAVSLGGPDNALVNSTLTAINFAVTAKGDRTEISGNTVTGFAGDALRALGDHARVSNNTVRDCVAINGNHDDGFQSWSNKKGQNGKLPQTGLIVENNSFIEWTGAKDHPLRCSLQGIGLFDGFYEDVTIRNNIVLVSAYHGISVYGGRGVRILNNTVLHVDGKAGLRHPWIMVNDKKNGDPARRVLVENNIATDFRMALRSEKANFDRRYNATLRYPARLFPNVAAGDVITTIQKNDLVDAGNPQSTPKTDRFGRVRPLGNGPDIGAVEWR